MLKFGGCGILLDIEGTTSSVRFVYDVMFPFVRRELTTYLSTNWETDNLHEACELIARAPAHSSPPKATTFGHDCQTSSF